MTFKKDNKTDLTSKLDNVTYESRVGFRDQNGHAIKSRKQCDLCFSLSNLALIVASITGLFFLIVFFYDEPLYSYLEILFSTTFYRQFVFIAVIIPLVILIPLFNALTGLFLRNSKQVYTNFSLLIVKIVYVSILAILIFIGLIFVIPYVRESSVSNQLDLEFLHHMNRRFANGFSLQFLDDIQESYLCCDTMWYRANNAENRLPLSCYTTTVPLQPHYETCPSVLGRLISLRCKIIGASLLVILISLIALIIIGICELMGQEYNVARREEYYRRMKAGQASNQIDNKFIDEPQDENHTNRLTNNSPDTRDHIVTSHIDDDIIGDEISDRLRIEDRERETPLLSSYSRTKNHGVGSARRSERPPPILTRANFTSLDDHRKSPSFVDNRDQTMRVEDIHKRPLGREQSHSPNKSSLKRGTSNGMIDSDLDAEENESVHEYLREVQTRRSSMNVRFNIK